MKTTAATLVVLIAAVSAGCGGSDRGSTTTSAASSPPPTSAVPPPTSTTPTATTNTPPKKHRTKPQPLTTEHPSTAPLTVGSGYKCNGKTLKTLKGSGPVVVKPAVVKPGQPFTVTVTQRNAHVAVVSLAGVTNIPIQVNAKPQGGNLVATIRMPARASCGNKALDIEGDLSAQAFIGVS